MGRGEVKRPNGKVKARDLFVGIGFFLLESVTCVTDGESKARPRYGLSGRNWPIPPQEVR